MNLCPTSLLQTTSELGREQHQQALTQHKEKVKELRAELVATDGQIQALNPHLNLDTLEERCELEIEGIYLGRVRDRCLPWIELETENVYLYRRVRDRMCLS